MKRVCANIDDEEKAQFERICSAIGINTTIAISVFVKATIRKNGLPFPLILEPSQPCSEANLDAIRLSVEKARGEHSEL